MKSNSIRNFLVFFTIIISILSTFIVTTYAFKSQTYEKSANDEKISPMGTTYFVLRDGSIMLRFYRPINDTCNEPDLHLRILSNTTGKLSPFEVKGFNKRVPDFNFCRLNGTKNSADYIQISKL